MHPYCPPRSSCVRLTVTAREPKVTGSQGNESRLFPRTPFAQAHWQEDPGLPAGPYDHGCCVYRVLTIGLFISAGMPGALTSGLPWLVISPPIHARSELGGHFCHPEVRGGVGFHVPTARTDPDLLAGLVWIQRSPFRPVMLTKKMTGHFAPHGFTSHR